MKILVVEDDEAQLLWLSKRCEAGHDKGKMRSPCNFSGCPWRGHRPTGPITFLCHSRVRRWHAGASWGCLAVGRITRSRPSCSV